MRGWAGWGVEVEVEVEMEMEETTENAKTQWPGERFCECWTEWYEFFKSFLMRARPELHLCIQTGIQSEGGEMYRLGPPRGILVGAPLAHKRSTELDTEIGGCLNLWSKQPGWIERDQHPSRSTIQSVFSPRTISSRSIHPQPSEMS